MPPSEAKAKTDVMVVPFLLDTSFLIDLARKNREAVHLLRKRTDNRESLYIPTIVVSEFLAGSKVARKDVERLIEAATILDFSVADAEESGQVARAAMKTGNFPGWNDCHIAGVAKSRGGLTIVTANPAHFPTSSTKTYPR
ncbi:MAG: type II toxin-antitoxin system VapC family toxin [Thermoplasmatota archaeon]